MAPSHLMPGFQEALQHCKHGNSGKIEENHPCKISPIIEQTGIQCLVIRAECACVIVNAEILKNRRERLMGDQTLYIKFLALLFLIK